jgi:hypothetical protein
MTVRVSGAQETRENLDRIGRRLETLLRERSTQASAAWEQTLRATIQHVVYDAYAPRIYRRNRNLLRAVDRAVSLRRDRAVHAVQVRLFDNAKKIRYRKRADGSIGPRGGSPPDRVPWEIELGEWPIPWHGFTAARPAYATTARLLHPEAVQLAQAVVADAVGGR